MAEIVTPIGARQAQRPGEVFCVDASHCTNAPSVQRGWVHKGQHGKVPTPTQRQSATLFGAVQVRTQRFSWQRAARGTSARFLEFLHQLQQRFPEALLILSVENASMHQSHAVKQCLPQHDWVALEHLAPYSPEYNPIERFWRWLKATIYGATAFVTIDDGISKVRQLMWHYHEGWLTSTIHCDFKDYQSIL